MTDGADFKRTGGLINRSSYLSEVLRSSPGPTVAFYEVLTEKLNAIGQLYNSHLGDN